MIGRFGPSEQQMWPDDLEIQLERLQQSQGPAYRAGLAWLLAAYGRDAIARSLVESRTGNVVSIAASPNWCGPHPGARLNPQSGYGAETHRPALQTWLRSLAGAIFVS